MAEHKVVPDPTYGYYRLDPIPSNSATSEFYQSRYYELISRGGRSPDIRRLMAGGSEAERERAWLHSSRYADALAILEEQDLPHRRLLDVGCGTGEFASFMIEKDWDVVGLEPSGDAAEIARGNGLEVHCMRIQNLVDTHPEYLSSFDAITLVNVLEHVPDPADLLGSARKLLVDTGALVVQTPNDFNVLQVAASKALNKGQWWVAIPDHINYFNFDSLRALLEGTGFKVVYSQATFPMELFLLMGDDYVGIPEVGGKCHEKRVRFEMTVPVHVRRRLYQALAQVGLGRECLVVGRLGSR